METLDIIIFAVLGIGALWGFIKGFVRTLVSWAAPLIAFLFANQWAAALASQFFPQIVRNRAALIFFAVAVFIAAAILIGLLGNLAKKIVDGINLGVLDHLSGLFLGALFAAILVGALTAFLIHIHLIKNPSPLALLISQGALKTFALFKGITAR